MKPIAALMLVVLLTGCAGPATHFYTLSSVAPARAGSAAARGCAGAPVMVRHVLLPGVLDRQALVMANGPDEIGISATARWAAPLDQMIGRVLAEDLRARLPAGSVLAPGDPVPATGAVGVGVTILRFVPDGAGQVTLRADWTLFDVHGRPIGTHSQTLSTAGGAATDAAVASMSRLLAELADHIAAALGDCRAVTG